MKIILIILIGIIILLLVSGMAIAYISSNRNGNVDKILGENEASGDVPDIIQTLRLKTKELVSREYEIMSKEGFPLHGYLIRSKKPSNVYVFYSHGYRSPDGGMEFGCLYPMWENYDYNCFFVDHRGHGKSGGNHISFGLHESEDNMEWLTFMKKEFGEDIQIILHGQSMGAATVLMMSDKELPNQVKCIVADCGYACYFDEALHILQFPGNRLVLEVANLYLRLVHNIDMKKAKPVEAVAHSIKPILFTHGGKDSFVPTYMGKLNYDSCISEKEFHVFPEAEHATSLLVYPDEYANCVGKFIHKFIEEGGKQYAKTRLGSNA